MTNIEILTSISSHSIDLIILLYSNFSIMGGGGGGGGGSLTFRELSKIFLSKFVYCRNTTCDENFKLKLCMCAQSHALGTRTKFQLEILTINVISDIVYFYEII